MHIDKVLAMDTSATEIIESLESMAFCSFSSTRAVALLRISMDQAIQESRNMKMSQDLFVSIDWISIPVVPAWAP
jgi:hypothetical protein